MPVVFQGNCLSRFELRCRRAAGCGKACGIAGSTRNVCRQTAVSRLSAADFPPSKALNSNQLGNSLRINMAETSGRPIRSHFGVLHMCAVAYLPIRHPKPLNCCPRRPSERPGKPPGGYRRGRSVSFVFCLPSVFRGACVCAKCRRRSTWRARSCEWRRRFRGR